jgi:2-succinyl-6-hydroxy-2,4-cyclohexadiene-1-carboxylate synthase
VTIALLHGFAGDPSAWDEVLAAWGVAARAIALPGHGAGPVRPTWEENLAAVAADTARCEVVVGYSLGARVALGLVATGRCARAILIGVNPGLPAAAGAERAARRASDATWAALLRERGSAAFADAWGAQPLFATQARVAPDKRAARRAQRLRHDPEQLARSLEVMGLAEMPDCAAALHAPGVALVVGADDTKYLAIAHAHGVPVHAIAHSGHDPTLEQPVALAAQLSNLTRS